MTTVNLPPELLHIIFETAILPDFLLDPAYRLGASSIWCRNMRTIKSIMLVCKLWYEVSIPFLYSQIYIRRPNQLESLLPALESSGANIKQHVRSVDVSSYISTTDDWDSHGADFTRFHACLEKILKECPNLSRFAYRPTPFPFDTIQASPWSWPTNLTWLEIDLEVRYSGGIEAVLRLSSSTLTHLFLHGQWLNSDTATQKFETIGILFPELTTLSLVRSATALLQVFAMPKLRNLINYDMNYMVLHLPESKGVTPQISTFVGGYGPRLEYVRLRSIGFKHSAHLESLTYYEGDSDILQVLLDHCKNLRRIGVCRAWIPHLARVTHACLEWIDVHPRFGDDGSETVKLRDEFARRGTLREVQRGMPALRGVRFISGVPDHCEHLVYRIQHQQAGDDSYTVHLYGAHLRSSPDELAWIIPDYSSRSEDSELDEADDGDYDPGLEDSGDDETSSSESEDGNVDSDSDFGASEADASGL